MARLPVAGSDLFGREEELRGFSFDPSLSGRLDTAVVNQRVNGPPFERFH